MNFIVSYTMRFTKKKRSCVLTNKGIIRRLRNHFIPSMGNI